MLALKEKKKPTSELKELEQRFKDLKLKPEELEICRSVISDVNVFFAKTEHHFGAKIDANAIQARDRTAYRERLRMMGTWIGFYEFAVLAAIYQVGFYIAMPATTVGRWRRYQVGGAPLIHHMVLSWTGTHYELAQLTRVNATEEYTSVTTRQTNPRGDCGIESFLLLLFLTPGVARPQGATRIKALEAQKYFRFPAKLAGNNVISADQPYYYHAIKILRALLADELTDPQVDASIIAEGVLPSTRQQSSWHEIMGVEQARKLVLKGDPSAVTVGVIDGGFANCDALSSVLTIVDDPVGKTEHGTACCGLIAGYPNEKRGFLGGVAREDDFGKMKVSLVAASYDESGGAEKDIVVAGNLATRGARVISMSYRTADEKLSKTGDAIRDFNHELEEDEQCIFVVAAGNEGKKYNHELIALGQHAIVVTATSIFAERDYFVERQIRDCNRGPGVTVCAPGGDTVGKGQDALEVVSTKGPKAFEPFSNTSSATPMVAGVVALMLSVDPALTPATVREILCSTATQIDLEGGEWKKASAVLNSSLIPYGMRNAPYSIRYGFGRVDAEAAVAEVIKRKLR